MGCPIHTNCGETDIEVLIGKLTLTIVAVEVVEQPVVGFVTTQV